jgi:hypothetical protein
MVSLLLPLLILIRFSWALDVYVSPTGSDAASGSSPSDPFATLSRAFTALSISGTGGTAFLAGGVYERTSALYSGSLPITVRALNASDGATLSGGARVRGWALGAGGALRAPLPSGVGSCTLLCARGGQCRPRARTPNEGAYFTWAAPLCANLSNPACHEAARWGFVFSGADVPAAPYDEKRVEVSVFGGWTASRHAIASIHPANSTLLLQNPSNMPIGQWRNHDSEGGGRYFLDNIREGLDAPGEWYCDLPSQSIEYLPLPGESAATLELYLAVALEVLVVANASGGVTLQGPGLAVAHAAWACDFSAAQCCDFQSTSWQNYAAVHVKNTSAFSASLVEVAAVGGSAVWLDESTVDSSVRGCYLHDLAAGGVRVGAANTCSNGTVKNVSVSNNRIGRGGAVFPDGTGVVVHNAESVAIANNEIAYFSYTGVSLGWCWSYTNQTRVGGHAVIANWVHHLGINKQRQLGDAMACFYSLGELAGSEVHHNLCHDVGAYYTGGYGTSQDQASSGLKIHHNVIARTTGAGVNQHYGVGNTVVNNVVAFSNFNSTAVNGSTINRGAVRSYAQANLPSTMHVELNIVLQDDARAVPMNDMYLPWVEVGGAHGGPAGHGAWALNFTRNLYWNPANASLPALPVWGGCQECGAPGAAPRQLTFAEWQSGCGTDFASYKARAAAGNCSDSGARRGPPQDVGSVFADPLFADPENLNFTLLPGSPALALGFEPIDLSDLGPRGVPWPPLQPFSAPALG